MTQTVMTTGQGQVAPASEGLQTLVADWSSDQRAFKKVPWGKAMMWIFLVSDTFIFGAFLIGYMNVRMSTTAPWPNASEVFGLSVGGQSVPLLLATAALGASFVGMQAFEWTKLIVEEGVRPWGNPMGAAQFGAAFFMITGFHGTHVTIGVIFLIIVATKVLRGDLDREKPGFLTGRKGNYEIVEIMGLYWHFVDLVWVFIFAFFYLW